MDKLYLYDDIREKAIRASPEELVRQKVLHTLISHLGFPKKLVAVEVSIAQVASFITLSPPFKRRLDIVCFDHVRSKPLLVIECKAALINEKAKRQVIGYNRFIKAPFIGIASQKQILLGLQKDGLWEFTEGLLPYQRLLELTLG